MLTRLTPERQLARAIESRAVEAQLIRKLVQIGDDLVGDATPADQEGWERRPARARRPRRATRVSAAWRRCSLGHNLTNKKFQKQIRVNLEKVIGDAHNRGVSPMIAVVDAVRARVGDSPNDPNLAGKISKLFQNAYAGTAIRALLQNRAGSAGGLGFDSIVRELSNEREVDRRWTENLKIASSTQQADLTRTQNSKDWLGIRSGSTCKTPPTREQKARELSRRSAADLHRALHDGTNG